MVDLSRDKQKRKVLHLPKFSAGFYISFQSLKDRDRFIDSAGFKNLIGEATSAAKKYKGKLKPFWNPDWIISEWNYEFDFLDSKGVSVWNYISKHKDYHDLMRIVIEIKNKCENEIVILYISNS